MTAPIDASVRHVVVARDAAPAIAMATPDAAVPPDAAIDAALPIAPQMGTIIVKNDTWCQVSIDHSQPVQITNTKSFVVEAGRHDLACEQPGTDRVWTREVDVAANAHVTVEGTMLPPVTVTFEVAATLNGTAYERGAKTTVKPGFAEIVVHGEKKNAQLRAPCVVRDQPQVDCYTR